MNSRAQIRLRSSTWPQVGCGSKIFNTANFSFYFQSAFRIQPKQSNVRKIVAWGMLYLLSNVAIIFFLNPSLLTVFIGHISLAKWNVIVSAISTCLCEEGEYGPRYVPVIVVCVVWFFVVAAFYAFNLWNSWYCTSWWLLRWLMRLVVLVDVCTAQEHSLHRTWTWSTSLLLNPKYFQTMEYDPFLGTNERTSSPSSCCSAIMFV